MEYLDIYDEQKNYIGTEKRDIVHQKALWHQTVHCWLYDQEGNIYFQIRADEQKLYTTASGHLKAGESVKEGFGREIEEEIGIKVDYNKAIPVNVYKFVLDKIKEDGTIFRDRAFSNIYVCIFNGDYKDFYFDTTEVAGLVKINAEKTLELLKTETGTVEATIITQENNKNISKVKEIIFSDFLVNPTETAIGKYGEIINKVINLTSTK